MASPTGASARPDHAECMPDCPSVNVRAADQARRDIGLETRSWSSSLRVWINRRAGTRCAGWRQSCGHGSIGTMGTLIDAIILDGDPRTAAVLPGCGPRRWRLA